MGTRTTFTAAVGLLACVLAIAAAGCGGKSKSAATETTTEATTSTTTAAATTAPASTATTSTGAATSGASKAGAFATAQNCRQLTTLMNDLDKVTSGNVPKNVDQEAQVFQELAAKAPAAIQPDFQVLADSLKKVESALKGTDLSTLQSNPKAVAKLLKVIDVQAIAKAVADIGTWATKNCKPGG